MREAALTLALGRDDFEPCLAARGLAGLRRLGAGIRRRIEAAAATGPFGASRTSRFARDAAAPVFRERWSPEGSA